MDKEYILDNLERIIAGLEFDPDYEIPQVVNDLWILYEQIKEE